MMERKCYKKSYIEDDSETTKRNYFHIFKYDEQIEKIIEEVDEYNNKW